MKYYTRCPLFTCDRPLQRFTNLSAVIPRSYKNEDISKEIATSPTSPLSPKLPSKPPTRRRRPSQNTLIEKTEELFNCKHIGWKIPPQGKGCKTLDVERGVWDKKCHPVKLAGNCPVLPLWSIIEIINL